MRGVVQVGLQNASKVEQQDKAGLMCCLSYTTLKGSDNTGELSLSVGHFFTAATCFARLYLRLTAMLLLNLETRKYSNFRSCVALLSSTIWFVLLCTVCYTILGYHFSGFNS